MPAPRLDRSPLRAWGCRTALALTLGAVTVAGNPWAPPAVALAQEGGVQKLIDRGSDQFDDLRYEESIQTLSAALLRPGASKPQKVEIYRLLAYNFITINRSEEADAAVRGILVIDPDFKLSEKESPRFRDFFEETRKKWEDEGRPGLEEASGAGKVQAAAKIVHTSPAQVEPGTIIKLSGKIEDPAGVVHSVELAYRTGSKGKFTTRTLAYSMGDFRGQIPATVVKPPLVEYYLIAADSAGLPLAARGDADAPLRVTVPDDSGGGVLTSPWFWIPVGVVVVGGAILVGALAAGGGTDDPGSRTSTVQINVGE